MKIAVDFDGTLQLKDKEPNRALIGFLLENKRNGAKIVLFTARTGKSLAEAVNWSRRYGLIYDEIYGGKPVADVYIDDKALNPFK